METEAHARLKSLALRFLRGLGFQALATEVACPIGRHRLDVAGYIDASPPSPLDAPERAGLFTRPGARTPIEPRTVVIECKQDRSDFLRERHELERLLARRARLEARRSDFERTRLPSLEPGLRRGGAFLFHDLESWDFGAARSPEYRGLLRRIDRTDAAIHRGAKLSRMARYRLADRLYVLAPGALIAPRELPAGWGLLEAPGAALRAGAVLDGAAVTMRRPAAPQRSPARFRARLLRNIAVAATHMALGAARPDRP